ncbi:hypothetical protein QUB68_25335 [Microcoleus sp. A006_D1]|uniref:hypothetical protein n=1 Tax=Microcoleus sp. A006_D1 TaxID=3055267 RepID=UPI002FD47E30
MNYSNRKFLVRKFYEEEIGRFYHQYDSLSDFFPDCRIGCLQLFGEFGDGLESVEIERPPQDIPKTVADTYDRHFWYSQHSLSEIYLVKIPVESQISFAILIQGYVDDGWDNSGSFIEVFDQQGQFLGSGRCDRECKYLETFAIEWLERQLNGRDLSTSSPPWIGDEPEGQAASEPMWSEEILSQHAVKIEREGSIIRYVIFSED